MKKRKKTTPRTKAWNAFSKYIRLSDAIKTTGNQDYCVCVTCGRTYPAFGLGCIQAGHFVPGRTNAILFDEECVRGQCLTDHSNLRMFNGNYRNISKIKRGDKLWGFNKDNFERKLSVVEVARSFIPKELFRIDLEDGSSFYATGDHQIIANKKWIYIKNLLHSVLTYDILEL